jgi:hypothetical protein
MAEPLSYGQQAINHAKQRGILPSRNSTRKEPKAEAAAPRRVPPYKPFPLAALPPTVREYVDASAAAIGCDPALVALPALAVAAGCIGNSCAIRLRRGWTEPAVIWAVTVATSGQLKSPAWAAAQDPLMEHQADLAAEEQRDREAYEQALTDWQDKPKGQRGPRPEKPGQQIVSFYRYCG